MGRSKYVRFSLPGVLFVLVTSTVFIILILGSSEKIFLQSLVPSAPQLKLVVATTKSRSLYVTTDSANRIQNGSTTTTSIPSIKSTNETTGNKLLIKNLNITNETSTSNEWTKFHFQLDTDMVDLVRRFKERGGVAEKPVFPYRFNFTSYNIDKCTTGELSFIILIKSAIGNIARRNGIRKTWAKDSELKKYNATRKFLVGTANSRLAFSIQEENKLYKDIIEISFQDNYYNNTLKTIGGIHWVAEHCNRAKFLVMVDDDMFVATPRVSQYLKVNISANTSFYGGQTFTHFPLRKKGSKWYISKEDYPYNVYPSMPSGGFTIMSMPFVIDVHIASQYTKKFIFDDCYMGILAYRLRVKPTHIPTIVMWKVSRRDLIKTPIMAAHGYTMKTMIDDWKIFNSRKVV